MTTRGYCDATRVRRPSGVLAIRVFAILMVMFLWPVSSAWSDPSGLVENTVQSPGPKTVGAGPVNGATPEQSSPPPSQGVESSADGDRPWLKRMDDALDFEISAFGAVLFLLLGLLLFAIFRGLHHLISLLRITRSRRQQILRLLPVGETFVALLYLLTAIPMVFKDHPHYSPIVLTVLIAGIIWVSWFAIRDFVSGLFLRAGGFCQQGDWIRSSEIQGTVVRLGYRVLELEARNGETVYVPYSRISRQALARVPAMKGLARHQFELVTPSERAAPELSALIRNTILNHHWTSLIQAPRIERLDGGRYELTVFALDVAYAPAIERSVREAIQETEVLDEDITASA